MQKRVTVFSNNYEKFIAIAKKMRFKTINRNFLDMNRKGNKQLLIWFYAMNSLNLMLNNKSSWYSLPMNFNFANKIYLLKDFSKQKTDCSLKHVSCVLNDKRFYINGQCMSITDNLNYVPLAKTGKHKKIRIINQKKVFSMRKVSDALLALLSKIIFGNANYLNWKKLEREKENEHLTYKEYAINNNFEQFSSDYYQENYFLEEDNLQDESQEKNTDPPNEKILEFDEIEKIIGKL